MAASGAELSLRSENDIELQRRNIRRAMRLGTWIWPCFTALDAYMCLVLYPGAPFLLFLLDRVAVEAFLVAVYRTTFRSGIPLATLQKQQRLSFFIAALGISLMGVHLGGLRSSYMHGISIVCLVHAAVIPAPWRRSLCLFVPIGLVFPAVMLLASAISPGERAEWFSLESLAVFASNYVFVISSTIVAMTSGHLVWAAQQQVYRARRLGRYRLQAQLGLGGMGEVWLAWDQSLRRNVALKLLRTNGASDAASIRRFEREAHAASQLKGRHTVHVYDFGASDDGIYYIAMEYLSGKDLAALVHENGPLPPERATRFALQACKSLSEAHEAGIIHRDIKPQNFFVTQLGENQESLKLLDFGIARFHTPEANVEVTQPGVLTGTPAYMAPELWNGGNADIRSDIYALGATMYFMLTGGAPFEGNGPGDLQLAHLGRKPEPPSLRLQAPLPETLERIVLGCLAKSPEHRYQSVRELYDALSREVASLWNHSATGAMSGCR